MKFNINNKRLKRQLTEFYSGCLKKLYNNKLLREKRLTLEMLEKGKKQLLASPQFKKLCEKLVNDITKRSVLTQTHEWKELFDKAKAKRKVSLDYTYKQYQKDIVDKIARQNMLMLKSIPESILKMSRDKWSKTLRKQVMTGEVSRNAFKKELESHAVKNAEMIARTEAAKLQTDIIKERSVNIGSIAYKWRASIDSRTRQSHKEMDDVIVFWRDKLEEKPMLDNYHCDAGQIFNCRCDAQPIFDMNDLNGKETWTVWDYRINAKIAANRKLVEQWLTQGGLS